jgi:5-methylcytosine-specific restriction endonuclease McrA
MPYKDRNAKKNNAAKWYQNNKNRLDTLHKKWKKENPEKIRIINRRADHKHYYNNREEHVARCMRWNKAHPEAARKQHIAIAARRRTRIAKGGGSFSAEQWFLLCNFYGSRCLCCRKNKRLEADHVVPVSKSGSSNIGNIQPLCRSCNAKKGTKTTDYRKQPEGSAMSGGENKPCLFI